jgi:PAS domain S-box-containing protein
VGKLRGRTLFDIFRTSSPEFSPIAAHQQAICGTTGPLTFTLANMTFHGYVAPLRVQGEIAGCVAAVCDEPQLDMRRASILNTVQDLILFLDTDGTIREVNRTATGLPQDHVVHRPVYDFVPADSHEPLRKAIESVLETNRVAILEVRFMRRFGEPSWQLMRIGPMQMHGKTTGLVLMASDITQHKLAIQKLQAEEDLLRDLLELQDRERRMVAYEIHDGFIQEVVGARMILQGLRRLLVDVEPSTVARFDSAVSLLAHAVNEGRRLISELRPMIIDEMGIVDAMEFLIGEEEARGDMAIRFSHRIQCERLPALLQATVFRITRESLNNARRHGAATQVDIRLTQIGTKFLILEVQDNGVGFNPDAVPSDRYGLAGIRERAQLFGGGATIESSPNKGTRITVKLSLGVPPDDHSGEHTDWTWTT